LPTDSRIAVVIPARNAGSFLREALDSVFAQDLRPAEVVVVDDGSTDDTRSVARGYGQGVHCLSVAAPAGPGARAAAAPKIASAGSSARARNAGIAATRGELIAFLDADDIWVPEKTSRQIALLDAHPDLAMIFSDMRSFEGDRRSETTYFQERGFTGACTASSIFLADMVSTPTVILRRSVLAGCGGFDERLGVGQDTDLWFRIALRHRFAAISQPLVLRRFHGSNITKDARRLAAAVVEIWGSHLDAIVEREPHMRRAILSDYAAKRWHHHFLEGCAALHERRRGDARRRFLEAILARPGAARTYAYLGATLLGEGTLRKLKVGRSGRPGGTP
jgi:glycosyltransferase involved in cell wall biosynthesis